jgi:hypothetical protein
MQAPRSRAVGRHTLPTRALGCSVIVVDEATLMPDENNGLRRLLCPPQPEEPRRYFDDQRQRIENSIRPLLPEWERAIGLEQPNPQFREGLVEAILLCILLKDYTPDRLSERRKQLTIVSKRAGAVAEMVRRLDPHLQKAAGCFYPGIRSRFLELGKQAPEFDALSSVARGHADSLIADKGGPKGMFAFRRLVTSLAREFERATGRAAKVTWNYSYSSYEGRFIDLVENVLAIVLKLAPKMPHPSTTHARGRYIHAVTREPRRKRQGLQPRAKGAARSCLST